MVVTQDAQARAFGERARVRERVVRHGHGKMATEERLRTELVGIEGLTTYESYGDPEQTHHAHRRDDEGQPINAVVVRRWTNRLPATTGTVYLTNGPVSDPFVSFDHYDWRSVIEHGIFKEGKYPWHLGRFPKKTEAAVVVHCHFTEAFDGTLYGLSVVAAAADGCSCDLEYRRAGGRRHRSLALASEGGKPRQGHHFSGACLWDLPSGRTRRVDRDASASSPLSPWLSPDHPATLGIST